MERAEMHDTPKTDTRAGGDPILRIEELEISFGPTSVVRGVDLALRRGEILALVGESGSGKSMIGRAILGLLPEPGRVSRGRIRFDGHEITAPSSPEELRLLRGRSIGLIFQEPLSSLNPTMKIGPQMFEAMRLHTDLTEAQIRARALDMLRQVRLDRPEALLDRYPHEFSGGMRQRIMIASVMMLKPALLIADEPTTALDAVVQREVLDIMEEVARANGTSVILISHDLAVVARYAERVAVMEKGDLVETGTTRAVLADPQHAYTRRLLAAAELGAPDPVAGRAGAPLLRVENLSVDFREKKVLGLFGETVHHAVRDVSLTIAPGEFVGLVGESGSGKSTIGRAICKLTPKAAGRVVFDGQPLDQIGAGEERHLRQRIRVVFQDPVSSLNPRMRIGRIVREGLRHDRSLSDTERQQAAERMLEAVGLSRDMAARFPHALSGGQRQRVAIARALIARPDLIIADEPVSALDVTIQAQILALLKRLQADYGFACLFISHDLHIVEQLCARLYVLHKGRLMEEAATPALFASPRHPYTRRLLSASPRLERGEKGVHLAEHILPGIAGDDLAYYDAMRPEEPYRLIDLGAGHRVAIRGEQAGPPVR
ncbi:dipeptide ABC transporter ATP-binding protein [Pseudodonghicola flavimaris]|uniref:ABC transporter ATP-binding protein n=1 Tax=Pseudodonghicola flavimaris TaxID=3050036 RepID=A0ABT7F838_9RHOB|nr:ABC transporter ATP-binding protein [Pseudodonghicola flavimaris]MDK3020782.1 ABC transporter ATP-binding protein [Pseudodonghicola flavimaris]